MGIVESSTGHNPKGERKVAGIVYMAISIAVIIGVFLALFLGRQRGFDPQKSGDPATTAPDAGPGEANPGGNTQ